MKTVAWICSAAASLALGLAAPPAAAQGMKEVTLVQAHAKVGVGEDVFIYAVPQAMGWFAEENLKVNLKGVSGGTLAAQILQSGDAQFVTTAPEAVMTAREKGGTLKAVMAIRSQDGYQLAVTADSNIRSIKDLKGKTFGVASLASSAVPLVKGMMNDMGIATSDYTIVAAGTGGQAATALTANRVDVLALWDVMYAAIENRGVKLRTMDLPVIPKLAAFTLVSTDSFIEKNPKTVTGMCRAIAKGVVFTRENPVAAVKILYELFPDAATGGTDAAAVEADAHIMRTYLANTTGGDDKVPLGWNAPEKWAFSHQYYRDNGRLSKPQPAEAHYTNDFIKDCNDFDAKAVREAARRR